jgi:hypothetical protein
MRTLKILGSLLLTLLIAGCHCERELTWTEPSLGNYKQWKEFLPVTVAEPGTAIATTQTQISNVSPRMAAAKMMQALESYNANSDFRFSTGFTIAQNDTSEGASGPAVTDVVINGHYYYVAMLDYPPDSKAVRTQTNGKIPGIAVVDAEDETKPAWIRTEDADGNPYAITIYLSQQENIDENNIYRFLRGKGYRTYGSHKLSNPTMELDDKWRPFFTCTYTNDDAYARVGEAFYPEELLVVDAQTQEVQSYALDNPVTTDVDERVEIPDWVDQVYAPDLIVSWIHYWGYNPRNYAKTSELDRLIPDGNMVDMVMNANNTNLVFVVYITSTLPDRSMVGVMLTDPRTAESTFYPTQGTEQAMATKSAAINAIKQATVLWDYSVEDLTLHTIYGTPTWEGVLTRPASTQAKYLTSDGLGTYMAYNSLYAGTVLLEANADMKPSSVMWADSKHEAFTHYEAHLYLKGTQRVGSNVLEDREIEGQVSEIFTITTDGNTSYLIRLALRENELWEVPLTYIGDPNTEDVLSVLAGDTVYLRYGDPQNRDTYLVREIYEI